MEFKEYRLFELSKDNKGYYGIGASAVEYDKNLYTYLRITDIKDDGSLNYSNLKSVNDENANKFILENGDIVFARTGNSTGKSYYYDGEILNLVYAGFLIKFSLNDKKVNPKFIKYYTMTNEYKNWVKEIQTGSTRGNINEKMYGNMRIKLPPRYYQDEVVSLLDKIDKKIKINNQINDNLHDLAEQIFFEIYKNGRERTLGDLLENISTGARPKGGAKNSGIPSVGAEKIERFGIYDYSSEKYIAEDFYEKLKNGKMNSGDVLLYKDGAYTGKVSMCLNWFPHKKSAVNEHVFILNTENNWAQNYLYFTLYNKQNKEMLERLAGAKAAQPGLNQTELKSLKINICDKEFIKKFENEVKPIMESIANNSLENKKLVELRDTLLPKLMNGEINLDKIEI